MPKYRLTRPAFIGRHYEKGAILDVEEGLAPSTAILLTEGQAADAEKISTPEPDLEEEPELDFNVSTFSEMNKGKAK